MVQLQARSLGTAAIMLGVGLFSGPVCAQTTPSGTSATDPGVRGGAPGSGQPLSLSKNELNFFNAAKQVFSEVDTVPLGLGPRYTLDSCGGCHAQPAIGGSHPRSTFRAQSIDNVGVMQ
jgi:hypothetical protein